MNRKRWLLVLMLLVSGLFIPSSLFIARFVSASAARLWHSSTSGGMLVYASDFDSFALGQTQPFPGAPDQDGWFSELAVSPAYGEIQNTIAQAGQALHEFTTTNIPGQPQTIDKRYITPPNLSIHPRITLQVDFYAHTSDLQAENVYDAYMMLFGGPHPGFEMLAFNLFSGGFGNPKGTAGVSVGLSFFNGTTNNEPVPLTVGQQLAWDTWHSLTLVADQADDHYVSLTLDGETENLSAYILPRSEVSVGVWERGQLIEEILAQVIPHNATGDETDDDIFWDNLSLMVAGGQEIFLPVVIR